MCQTPKALKLKELATRHNHRDAVVCGENYSFYYCDQISLLQVENVTSTVYRYKMNVFVVTTKYKLCCKESRQTERKKQNSCYSIKTGADAGGKRAGHMAH